MASSKCGGQKRSGGLCTQPAGWGTPHPGRGRCKLHGGSTKSHLAADREQQARAAVVTYGLPVDISPTEAILEEVRWTAGHVAWLRGIVQALDQDALTWGVSKRATGSTPAEQDDHQSVPIDEDGKVVVRMGQEVTEQAAVNVWLKLYLEERKHLVDVAATAVRIGIEERRVRLEEEKGALLVVGLQWLFAELGLSARKLELANQLAITMLRSLADGRPPIAGEVVA